MSCVCFPQLCILHSADTHKHTQNDGTKHETAKLICQSHPLFSFRWLIFNVANQAIFTILIRLHLELNRRVFRSFLLLTCHPVSWLLASQLTQSYLYFCCAKSIDTKVCLFLLFQSILDRQYLLTFPLMSPQMQNTGRISCCIYSGSFLNTKTSSNQANSLLSPCPKCIFQTSFLNDIMD